MRRDDGGGGFDMGLPQTLSTDAVIAAIANAGIALGKHQEKYVHWNVH